MIFYAQFNATATETSIGFANTWTFAGFESRAERDAWVALRPDRRDIAAISRKEAWKMASAYERHRAKNGGYLCSHLFRQDAGGKFVSVF